MTGARGDSRRDVPTYRRFGAILTGGVVLCVLLAGLLVLGIWQMYGAFNDTARSGLRLLRLSDGMAQLDMEMTASARLAAATGNLAWEERYHRSEEAMTDAMAAAVNMGPDAFRVAMAQGDAVFRLLTAMEHRALDLARRGQNAQALAILTDEAYQRHKYSFRGGLQTAMETIEASASESLGRQKNNAWWLSAAALAVLVLLTTAWASLAWMARRYAKGLEDGGRRLRAAQILLEDRVRERTAKLEEANQILQNEIRQRAKAEEEHAISSQTLRTIFDSVHDGIFVQDPVSGAVLDANQAGCRMLGYSLDELKRLGVEDVSMGDPALARQAAQFHIAGAVGGEPQVFEWLMRRRNGERLWVEASLKHAYVQGAPRLLSVLRDIRERKRAESAARRR